MFRLLKLKPPNGWNAVGWEFVIVTLGVLLALSAQEAVQSLHWNREVRETRQALDAELSRNLAAFRYGMSLSGCVAARAEELQKWAESFRTGTPLKLKHEILLTPGFAIRTEVWDLIDGEIASRIPLKDRLNYSGLYSGMKGFNNLVTEGSEAWLAIAEYDGASGLAEADVRKIVLAAKALKSTSAVLPAFDTTMSRQARELGLKPDPNLLRTANPIIAENRQAACEPYL
jgi:hypothetical protein